MPANHTPQTHPTPSPTHAELVARLRAAGPPPSFAHVFDPDLIRRLTSTDIVIGDDGEDAPRTRKRSPIQATLPPTLAPRLIQRDAAAAYVGVSPNTFDKMVADGSMPGPRRLTERRLAWDVRQLDAAIDRLPGDGNSDADTDATDHSWDDIDAQAKNKPPVH